MRDLEIRGAGNILGNQQSGHIAAVGYELYCQLLENAVRGLKGQRLKSPMEVAIDLPWQAYLPRDYVPGQKLRTLPQLLSHPFHSDPSLPADPSGICLESEYDAADQVQLVVQRGLKLDPALGPHTSNTAPKTAVGGEEQRRGPSGLGTQPEMRVKEILEASAQGERKTRPRQILAVVASMIGGYPHGAHNIGQSFGLIDRVVVQEISVDLVHGEPKQWTVLQRKRSANPGRQPALSRLPAPVALHGISLVNINAKCKPRAARTLHIDGPGLGIVITVCRNSPARSEPAKRLNLKSLKIPGQKQ